MLAILILLLFGTSYLAVDHFLATGPAPAVGEPIAGARSEVAPVPAAAETINAAPRTAVEAKKPGTDSPADREPAASDLLPHPMPAQAMPETASNPSRGEPDAGSRTLAADKMPTAFMATPVATTPEVAADPAAQGRTLLGRDHPRLLPTAIGPAALRNAAAAGDADAAFEVATRFAEGKGVAQDLKQAFAWYQRAAAQGHASAQFRVAAFHERGVGVEADRERAQLWYRRAAEQGHIKAMHNLAVLMVGKGGDRAAYAAAARWFREAAERGLADSQYNLATLYEDGQGVAKSLPEAYKWFALAARSGDRGAAQRQALVRSRLNGGEVAAAEQMVAAWHVRAAGAPIEAADAAGSAKAGK